MVSKTVDAKMLQMVRNNAIISFGKVVYMTKVLSHLGSVSQK